MNLINRIRSLGRLQEPRRSNSKISLKGKGLRRGKFLRFCNENYSNDVQTTLGSTAMPKGHYGLSSGTCFTGAASVTNTGVS